MPRRQQHVQIAEEDGSEDAEMGTTEQQPTREALGMRASEYLELNEQIKSLASQTAILRKALKTSEKNLFTTMSLLGVEDFEANGVKISRVKKLQLTE